MFYLFLSIVVCCILILLFVNYNKKSIEKFQSVRHITMDDVLDKHCLDTQGLTDYDWTNKECTVYDCPREKCHTLKKDLYYSTNPDAYYYVENNDRKVWVKKDDDKPGSCITKHNPDSNIFCEPNSVPTCERKFMVDKSAYAFNSSTGVWEEKRINYIMNSNGDCVLRDVNQPFKSVQLKNKNFELLEGSLTNDVVYLDTPGRDCRLKYDGLGKYYYDDSVSPEFRVDMKNFKSFNPRTNEFICENNSRKKYGHTDSNGFECGWIDGEPDCGSCKKRRGTSCYVFNSNDRLYEKRNFIQTYFNHDLDDATSLKCDTYLVNPEKNDQFDNENFGSLFLDDLSERKIDQYVLQKSQPYVISEATFTSNIHCSKDVNPDQCIDDKKTCTVIGSELSESVKSQLSFYSAGDPNIFNIDNRFVDVNYKRRWNASGSACEYCIVHNGKIIEDSCTESEPCAGSLQTFKCPVGKKLDVDSTGFEKYCVPCESHEYYDDTESNCKLLNGCTKGYYFNPFDTVSDAFRLYDIDKKQTITDNSASVENRVDKISYENYKYAFLNNNDTMQCTSCPDNHYQNNVNSTSLECKECTGTDDFGNIHYVDAQNNCVGCVRPGVEYKGNNPKYVKYENGGIKKTCPVCPTLTDRQYPDQKVVSLTLDDGTDGKCFRDCQYSANIENGFINESNKKEYDNETSKYPPCNIRCTDNHYIDTLTNTCKKCPIGQENTTNPTATSCTPCPEATYNDVPGGSCKSCPVPLQTQLRDNLISSPEGSTSIESCSIKCEGHDTRVGYDGVGYKLYDCPADECLLGYDKQAINAGHKIVSVNGVQNSSTTGLCEQLPGGASIDPGQDNECDAGYVPYKTETFVAEPTVETFETTYCCKSDMTYDTSTSACVCKPKAFFDADQSIPMNMKKHVATYAYSPFSNKCESTCVPNASKNYYGECIMNCASDEYVNMSNSTCVKCPPAPNATTMKIKSGASGENVDDCEPETCDPNFSLTYNNILKKNECIEKESDCTFYSKQAPHNLDGVHYNNYVYIQDDDSYRKNMNAIEQPMYLKKNSESLKPSKCATMNNDIQLCTNYSDSDSSHYSFKRATENMILCCQNGNELQVVNGSGKKYSLCCPSGTKIAIKNHNSVDYVDCCSTNTALVVSPDGSKTNCCPSSTSTKVYGVDNTTGECTLTCIDGELNQDGTDCIPYIDCPSSIYVKGPTDPVNGYHEWESSNVPHSTLECPIQETLDGESLQYWYDNGKRCDYVSNRYICCEDQNATYDRNTRKCKKICPSSREYRQGPFMPGNDYLIQNLEANPQYGDYLRFDASQNKHVYDCPSSTANEPECITGYVKNVLPNGDIQCQALNNIRCYSNIVNPNDPSNNNGSYYVRGNVESLSEDCPTGTSESEPSCNTGLIPYGRDKYACCNPNSSGVSISFSPEDNACVSSSCSENKVPLGNDGACQCTLAWDSGVSDNGITTYSLYRPTSTCLSMNMNLPPNNATSCTSNSGDTYSEGQVKYCCDNGSTPLIRDDGRIECNDVWSQDIKPLEISGYNQHSTILHKIDLDLAHKINLLKK